jgi:hypothetical protein
MKQGRGEYKIRDSVAKRSSRHQQMARVMHSKKLHRGLLGEEKPRLAFPQAFLPQVRARTRAGLKTCDLIKAGLFITDTEISQKQRFDQD